MIQIDMDMPVSCFYCPIQQRVLTLGGKCMCFCGLIKHELNDTTKRHESCPLVKVKNGEQKQTQPERKTGRWIPCPQNASWLYVYKCSECGGYLQISDVDGKGYKANYCSYCGAKMEGERKE